MKAAAALFMIAAWHTCLTSAQTSTCSVSITGAPTGEVQAASIACSGRTVQMTGALALQPFSANFSTGAPARPHPAGISGVACLLMVLSLRLNVDGSPGPTVGPPAIACKLCTYYRTVESMVMLVALITTDAGCCCPDRYARADVDPGHSAGVSFSVDAAAESLLSISGQQVRVKMHHP